MSDIIFTYEDSKKMFNKPYVVLVEGADEELFINGESVCCHKRLYSSDILDALKENGIINFEYREE